MSEQEIKDLIKPTVERYMQAHPELRNTGWLPEKRKVINDWWQWVQRGDTGFVLIQLAPYKADVYDVFWNLVDELTGQASE